MSQYRPTADTVLANLRWSLAAASHGSVYNTYPNGPGTRPVTREYSDHQRRCHAGDAAGYAETLRELHPQTYAAWQAGQAEHPAP